MVSQRKLIANHQNAQKSTGPKTKEGKDRSSQNATTHGLFCHSLLLPHDEPVIFHTLRDSYLLSLKPQNLPELQLVDQIVSAMWRLRRVQDAESLLHSDYRTTYVHDQRVTNGADTKEISLLASCCTYIDDRIEPKLDRLARHEQRYQRTIHRCYRELRQLRKDKVDDLPTCPYYDHPEKVYHLNPKDIPQDESTWPDFNQQNDDDDAQSDQNEPTPSSPPITNNESPITSDQIQPPENDEPMTSDQGPMTNDQEQITNHQNEPTDPASISTDNEPLTTANQIPLQSEECNPSKSTSSAIPAS